MHALPTWQITAFVGLLALAALEGGYRVGAYRARPSEDATNAVGLIAGAVLGLLGLLLGFRFPSPRIAMTTVASSWFRKPMR